MRPLTAIGDENEWPPGSLSLLAPPPKTTVPSLSFQPCSCVVPPEATAQAMALLPVASVTVTIGEPPPVAHQTTSPNVGGEPPLICTTPRSPEPFLQLAAAELR